MSGCNCCEAPPCPIPTIQCDSVAASGSKPTPCGWPNAGKYWLDKIETEALNEHVPTPCDQTYVRNTTRTITKGIVEGSCVTVSDVKTGTSSYTFDCGEEDYYYSCSASLGGGVWTGSWHSLNPEDSGSYGDCTGGRYTPIVTTYANEATGEETEDLITRITGELPSYPGTWGGGCGAIRNLSPDESSYSIQKMKWRVAHPPSGTCYLKVWLNRVFTPEGGGGPTVTPLTPYEWTGTGNPCVSDDSLPPTDEANEITSSPTEEGVPGTDGTTTIQIVKWTCVEGYEPGEGEPNGYPNLE